MTWDQVWVLSCEESQLERRRLASGSPSELIELGVLPSLQEMRASAEKVIRKDKKERRRDRLSKIKDRQNGSS
jgi:hypothetical protein